MPTSNSPRATQTPKRTLKALLVILAVIIAVDVLLCYVLEPYGAHTEVVWDQYRKAPHIDTVLVGSSTTAYSIDPQPFDDVLGGYTYNLGTPGQTLDNTLMSLETAYADHGVKRAVICLGYESLVAEPYINSAVAVAQAKCTGEPPWQALGDIGRLVLNEAFFPKHFSLTCAFPWTYNHVDYTLEEIGANVRNRLECDLMEACKRYSERPNTGEWRYRSQGFGGVHTTMPTAFAHGDKVTNYTDEPFNEYNISSLLQICDFCREHNITLYVVGAPYTYSAVRTYGDRYVEGMKRMRDLVTNAGGHFFDLNMAHHDLYDPHTNDFFDYWHLSNDGARGAGVVVSQLIRRLEQGENITGLFYDYTPQGWQQYCDAVDYVGLVDCTYETNEGGATITAEVLTGSNAQVEYRLDVFDSGTNEWKTVANYQASPTFVLPPQQNSSVATRVYARSANPERDQCEYVETVIDF